MNIGVTGLGIMGSAIARNLVDAGHRVSGFDTDPAALGRASAAGVQTLSSSAAVASAANVLLTSLPGEQALADTVSTCSTIRLRFCSFLALVFSHGHSHEKASPVPNLFGKRCYTRVQRTLSPAR
jgi:ketol-acid reductoisomerase